MLLATIVFDNLSQAQSFVNGDLEGIADYHSVPQGWHFIPYTDPICHAYTNVEATADIVDSAGPSVSGGIAGHAQSGNSFVSGLHSSIQPNYLWHEGIMQPVSGFAIGADYEISFYQTIVKQTNCIDHSGSWRVYLDGDLISTTTPSVSPLGAHDMNLQWDHRTVSFTATANMHTIKFIPWDDDGSIQNSSTDNNGGLRMGIDNISLVLPVPDPPVVHLGIDTVLCAGSELILDASYTNSTYHWHDNSTNATFAVHEAGTYWVEVTNPFGTTHASINVNYDSIPTVALDNHTFDCPMEPLTLNAGANTNYTYTWQDNSAGANHTVSEPGTYTVTVSNLCGSSSASAVVETQNCEFTLEMPNVFTPNGDHTNDIFVPTEINGIAEIQLIVFNRWGDVVYNTTDVLPSWDGESRGTPCAEGSYFWKIEASDFQGKQYSFHGNVHLIR